MRLIDADKLKQHYAYWESSKYDYMQEEKKLFDDIVDQQPTVDAVEVVRCKDCKYRSKKWYEDKRFKDGGYWLFVCENDNIAERVYGLAHDKDYCSYGERETT